MKRFYIVLPNSDYGKLMWNDLHNIDNIKFIEKPISTKNKLLLFLFKLHFSFTLNIKCNIPGKKIWRNHYNLSKIDFSINVDNFIIFTDVSLCYYTKEYLDKLKSSNKNIKLVLMMVNSFHRMKKAIWKQLDSFDLIFSFDENEANEYGFHYYPSFYSKKDEENTLYNGLSYNTDCFFVGVAKDRLQKLINIYDELESLGSNNEFYIVGVPKREQIPRKGIIYNKWLDYNTVLKKIQQANCILEVMDGNSAGVTLRTYEALCFNKKLITNNQKIKDSPFYNKNYIHVINNDNYIPKEFVLEKDTVDYCYDNRYSPKKFIETLTKLNL